MSKFIPFPFFYDDAPIDISFIFQDEKPAGKHGFLKTQGRDFVFEDGKKATFWGVNLNGAACFPEHDYAQKLATRLAKFGVNLVRFHQLDSEWHSPNIFSFTKGERVTSGKFDSRSMDRLDYLIHCLKQNGIYCYMDMFTYRKFKSDEGVENAKELKDEARPYSIYSERLIELQKDLCVRLWTHNNPYTGLSYADDPVFVMAEITNENDMFSFPIDVEPYKTDFMNKFDVWLKENGIDKSSSDYGEFVVDNKNEDVMKFKMYLQEKYYKEMMECMRGCGVKIPITGTNWLAFPANLKTQLVTDFFDAHPYQWDINWGEFEKRCNSKSITQRLFNFLVCAVTDTAPDMPTYVSEWDIPLPSEYRAESPIHCAAVGMLQGWSGYAIHTYAYSSKLDRVDKLAEEFTAPMMGGTAYRQGVFSTWNDPAKFGLFYHAALITRRGDVSPAKETVTLRNTSLSQFNMDAALGYMEKHKLVYDHTSFEGGEPAPRPEIDEILSDTGELYRNIKKNYGYVDTPKTKCVYGFLCKNGEITLNDMKVRCDTDFATIALSSLTNDDITNSDNMLLTTVGRAQNKGFKMAGDVVCDLGEAPVTIEVIEADIEIETKVEGLKVWAISAEGFYIGMVPAEYKDGKLRFTLGKTAQSMYYLIVKE